jgi:hypothetical protein
MAGNVTVEDIESVSPLGAYTYAAIAVAHYARRLRITLHYDSRPLSPAQAADLLETYVRRIRASAAAAPALSNRQGDTAEAAQQEP